VAWAENRSTKLLCSTFDPQPLQACDSGRGAFREPGLTAILCTDSGRCGWPNPGDASVTNPVTPTDREFLKHFSMVIGFLVLVMFALIGLALHLYSHHPPPTSPAHVEEVQSRIAPVGGVYAGDTGRAALQAAQDAAKKAAEAQVAYGGTLDGKTIFGNLCQTCHANAATGAPLISDKGAWGPRLAQGVDTLIKHATDGFTGSKGMMPAKGGNPSLTNEQVKATVEWMLTQVK
jgi:cytochrome c5